MIGSVELSRTIRLLEIDLGLVGRADLVLDALTRTTVCLSADKAFVSTFPGQVALTTSAMLLVRSGHTVFIDAPDTPMLGSQPPFRGSHLHEAMVSFGADLFESPKVKIGKPIEASSMAFVFGDPTAGIGLRSKRLMTVGLGDWHAEVAHWPQPVSEPVSDWPIGSILAGVLVATEAFKAASQALIPLSADPAFARELLAPSLQA